MGIMALHHLVVLEAQVQIPVVVLEELVETVKIMEITLLIQAVVAVAHSLAIQQIIPVVMVAMVK